MRGRSVHGDGRGRIRDGAHTSAVVMVTRMQEKQLGRRRKSRCDDGMEQCVEDDVCTLVRSGERGRGAMWREDDEEECGDGWV